MEEKEKNTESLLYMHNINKTYGQTKVLDNVEFSLAKGEIHALIGANGAGKSTLMKILCGEIDFDGGEIELNGKKTVPDSYGKMMEMGIVMLHQELSTVNGLTVAQYIFLGREPENGVFINDKKMIGEAEKLLEIIEADFSPDELMDNLSTPQKQLVEIIKAISFDLKILIFDEPTTSLGDRDVQKIFRIMKSLKEKGITIVFISHRLNELLAVSDRITVMRDGRYIKTLTTAETNENELIALLAGREMQAKRKKQTSLVPEDAETVLEVKNLSTVSLLKNVSFSLKKGEILGLSGLTGAGRSETARAICGIDEKISGEIRLNGKKVRIKSPKSAVENGLCYLSEDRNTEGYIPGRSIIGNTVISSMERYQKGIFLDDEKMALEAEEYNEKIKTKYADPHQDITSLSGGNIQKVLIAKWLIKNPQIFIFDEPTKGIDVCAKDEIYGIIQQIVKDGHSVILISSETKELMDNCDRIVVLCEGRVTGELPINEVTEEKLISYQTGAGSNEDHQ